MNSLFGQDMDIDKFNSVSSSYTLQQLCAIFLKSVTLQVEEANESESTSSLGSDSDEICSESEDDFSGDGSSNQDGSKKEVQIEAFLVQKPLTSVQNKRVIVRLSQWIKDEELATQISEYPLIVVTFSIIASPMMKKIFGVRMTALDPENN